MTLVTKQSIIDYVRAHDDGSASTKELIEQMEQDIKKEEFRCFITSDDLEEHLVESDLQDLRKYFGKPDGESFTNQECEIISDWVTDDFKGYLNHGLHIIIATSVEEMAYT